MLQFLFVVVVEEQRGLPVWTLQWSSCLSLLDTKITDVCEPRLVSVAPYSRGSHLVYPNAGTVLKIVWHCGKYQKQDRTKWNLHFGVTRPSEGRWPGPKDTIMITGRKPAPGTWGEAREVTGLLFPCEGSQGHCLISQWGIKKERAAGPSEEASSRQALKIHVKSGSWRD